MKEVTISVKDSSVLIETNIVLKQNFTWWHSKTHTSPSASLQQKSS